MNPEKLNDLEIPFPNIPDGIPSLFDLPALIERYRLLFRGYDSFAPEQFVMRHELDLEWVLQDLLTCSKCCGECQTKCGCKHFLKIDWAGMQFSGNRAMQFSVGECPGVAERKAQIQDLLAGKGIIRYQEPEDAAAKFNELKVKLQSKQERRNGVGRGERRKRANEWLD